MAGNAKRRSDLQKTHYKQYQNSGKWEINKRRKLTRHLKAFPNDLCAANALKIGFTYSRKSPKASVWSHSDKAAATLFREFGQSGIQVIEMKKARLDKAKEVKPAVTNE